MTEQKALIIQELESLTDLEGLMHQDIVETNLGQMVYWDSGSSRGPYNNDWVFFGRGGGKSIRWVTILIDNLSIRRGTLYFKKPYKIQTFWEGPLYQFSNGLLNELGIEE